MMIIRSSRHPLTLRYIMNYCITPCIDKAIACETMPRWSLPGFLQQNSVDELVLWLGGRIKWSYSWWTKPMKS